MKIAILDNQKLSKFTGKKGVMKKIRGEDRLINNNYFGFKFCQMEGGKINPFYVSGPIPPASIRKPKVF